MSHETQVQQQEDTNSLAKWLVDRRVKTADESSHFSYAGGKYFIPEEFNTIFLIKYAQTLQQSRASAGVSSLFMIEKRTPFFRMLFDLDMIQPGGVTESEVFALTALCCAVFKTYYPVLHTPEQLTCYVYHAPLMDKKGWGEGSSVPIVQKSGFHLIWPFLIVDQRQALHLREACIYAAKREFGERRRPANPYADVIDETVLMKNGLRMVGSDKRSKCNVCDGAGKIGEYGKCDVCFGSKTVAERRVYVPYFVVNEALQRDAARFAAVSDDGDYYQRVSLSSIRVFDRSATPGFTVPDLAAIPASLELLDAGGGGSGRKKRGRNAADASTATSEDRENAEGKLVTNRTLTAENAQEIDKSTMMFELVRDMIRGCAAPDSTLPWEFVDLTKFYFLKKNSRYMAKVKGPGANFCLNVSRQHCSSTVYFVLDAAGLRQRCFSRKEGLGTSFCREFSSAYFRLPPILTAALYQATARPSVASLRAAAVTPISGYVDSQKQMSAVESASKLHAAVVASACASAPRATFGIGSCTTTTPLGKIQSGTVAVPAGPGTAGATVAKAGGGSGSSALKRFGVYADFTPREIDKMRCVDLMNLDRRKMQEMREAAKEVQEQCFQGASIPTPRESEGKRRKKKASR